MRNTLKYGLWMTFLLIVTAMTTFGQGPLQKRIDFSINSPYALRMGDYLLPPGNYVLHQILQNDLNLFGLYPDNLTNEPIAMIRTVRIDFQASNYPDDTRMFLEMDEESPDNHPVLQGWAIPGTDGWEVIGVVEKKTGVLTKLSSEHSHHSDRYKLDRTKLSSNKYDKNDRRSRIQLKRIDQ